MGEAATPPEPVQVGELPTVISAGNVNLMIVPVGMEAMGEVNEIV